VVIVQKNTVRIEEFRKSKRILQREMADMLGLSERQYRRIEKGDCSPNAWEAIRIADRLGVKDLRLLWSCSST
jgi:DNA-binding XRE family transcriptional regulator